MSAQQVLQEKYARETHGFWIGPGPAERLWLFVPAGADPADGAPLTRARPATDLEGLLWEQGRLAALARVLARQGVPVRLDTRPWWKRALDRFSSAFRG